jgi:colanic acid/amylovoran biosynthesis protein
MRGGYEVKKVFVDIYLAFNLGDDLFLDVLSKKFPECLFTVNYLGSDYDQFISKYKNVNRRRYTTINKIAQRLKIADSISNYDKIAEEHDALLFLGGSIFREEAYHHSLYEDRIKMVKEFKKREKPVYILGANFGPFETDQFLNDYKEFFMLCNDVCFRDIYSYELFKNLPQVRYSPDIVFQMGVEEYNILSDKKRVGFSIIDVRHKHGLANYYNDYINSTVKSIELLAAEGYECCLMSFCENEGDLDIIEKIKSKLSPETLMKVCIYDYKGNLKEAINLIASFKLFVSARFHANIIALLLGVGIMPIIYSQKTTNMLKDINMDEVVVNMSELSFQYDKDIILKAFNNKTDLEAVKTDAANQFGKFEEFVKTPVFIGG